MKKIILSGLLSLLTFPVFAVGTVNAAPPDAFPVVDPTKPVAHVAINVALERIFNTGFWILLGVSVVFFLIGAFYFLMGGSDPENAKKGKSIITYAIIAVVVAAMAQGISTLLRVVFPV